MIVDWQVYYDAAKKCHDLAADLREADKPVHAAVKGDCAGMAGDAPGCKEWGQTYDHVAQQTMQTFSSLANALTNYGCVLYANGYNYGIANKSNPAPSRPTMDQVGLYQVTIPTSVADNGIGIHHYGGVQEFFDALASKVISKFGGLPNGDVDKLAKADTTWTTFANHPTITGASARISAISDLFDGMDDTTNLQLIQDHFNTLRKGAENVVTAAQNMAAPVADYHTGTVSVSNSISSAISSSEWAIGLTVVAAFGFAWLSFGGSLAAGAAGTTVIVGETVDTIDTIYTASNLIKAVGLTAAVAGAVGVIHAFDKVPDLEKDIAALAIIIGMKVISEDGSLTVATRYEDLDTAPGIPLGGLTDESETYIKSKHVLGGDNVRSDKSIFSPEENLEELADAAESVQARGPNDYGNYEREVDAGHTVGNQSKDSGGQPTPRYKVITDRWGTVINMFPI